MSSFLLETNSADSSASSIKGIASQVEQIASTVGGFDVSDESGAGFPFGEARNAIASNLEAAAIKLQNSSTVLESVSHSHTQLQNQLTQQRNQALNPVSPSSFSGGGGGGMYSGAGVGAGMAGAAAGMAGSAGMEGAASTPTTPANLSPESMDPSITSKRLKEEEEKKKTEEEEAKAKEKKMKEEEEAKEKEKEQEEEENQKREQEIETPEKVGYATIDSSQTSEETKELMENEDFQYDEEGYARFGDKYVIACDETMGEVGDTITFVKEDGTEIECVIGITTSEESNQGTIHFLIDKNKAYSFTTNEVSETILHDVLRIENRSNIFDLQQLQKENPIAAQTIDYINENIKTTEFTPTQTESGGYDCSSFIQETYKASEITLPPATEIPTENVKEFWSNNGFEWVEGPIDTSTLKPGDILMNENNYSEMYYGNGFYVGAFSFNNKEEEERKLRIMKSLADYSTYNGYLRYVGTKA